MRFLTGFGKLMIYSRIAVHVAVVYLFRMGPLRYVVFLRRAAVLLFNFWPDKVVKTHNGYKLQLYLPHIRLRRSFMHWSRSLCVSRRVLLQWFIQ